MMASETLCCCEYENKQGERSHLLACCCDCQAFDEIADRCIKCEHVPSSLIDRFLDTLMDRCRFPGLTGGGAIRVNLELATPIFVIPASLAISAYGPWTTAIVLMLLPVFWGFFYATWKRRTNKTRTKFFLVWGVTSLVFNYFLFEIVICALTNVSVIHNLLISMSVVGMVAALWSAKQDPGVVPERKLQQYLSESLALFGLYELQQYLSKSSAGRLESQDEDLESFEVVQTEDVESANQDTDNPELEATKGEHYVNKGCNWCEKCCIERPSRTYHCPVCNVCIMGRDHHCVWIDSCIGSRNHRSFLIAMLMFVVTGYYGSYVTVKSVCDPRSPHRIDCSMATAYSDFKWGICYAGALYSILVCNMMLIVLMQQIILISQNCTSREMHEAGRLGNTKWLLYRIGNPYNRGFVQNWKDFIFQRRSRYVPVYDYETV